MLWVYNIIFYHSLCGKINLRLALPYKEGGSEKQIESRENLWYHLKIDGIKSGSAAGFYDS